MPQDEKVRAVIFNLMVLITGGALGFGSSQALLATRVAAAEVEVTNLKKVTGELKQADKDESERTDRRIANLISLQTEQVKQGTELISLIRVQNQMKP